MLVYQDKIGNKLYKKYIKTRDIWQYYAKNKKNRIVNERGLGYMFRKAKIQTRNIKPLFGHIYNLSSNKIRLIKMRF